MMRSTATGRAPSEDSSLNRARHHHSSSWLFAAALFTTLSVLSSDAAAQGLRIELPSEAIPATDQFLWFIPIKVTNLLEVGIRGDSVTCEFEDLGPGTTRAGRHGRGVTFRPEKMLRELSRNDSAFIRYVGPALAEHARLTIRVHALTTRGKPVVSEGTCEVAPSPTGNRFPSNFLTDGKRRIEVVMVPEVWAQGKSPGLMMIHGEGSHARRLLPIAWQLANKGMAVMLVSMPGYGQSQGEADFAGPATVRAVGLALDQLRRWPTVDSTRIAVWGISQGASAAALLAARRGDLSCLVLQSGIFDPKTARRDTQDDSLRWALDKEARGSGGWDARSALRVAERVKGRVLILHGERDTVSPSNQAVDFAAKLRVAGVDCALDLFPTGGHDLMGGPALRRVQSFIAERFGTQVW
jgi:pimeloyl-ACP methyl ester carboxylesterase